MQWKLCFAQRLNRLGGCYTSAKGVPPLIVTGILTTVSASPSVPLKVAAPKLTVFSEFKRIETLLEPLLATAISSLSSAFIFAIALDLVFVPTLKLVALLKPPVPFPAKIETLLEPLLVTAKSSLLSPLKSPILMALGFKPTLMLVGVPKLPFPVPNKIEMLLEPLLATAISVRLSPFKSPTAIALGL